jgi:hypothetical protein
LATQVLECVKLYESTVMHYDDANWVEKLETLRMCIYFDTEAERQSAIAANESPETFQYKRSTYRMGQDRCRLAEGIQGTEVKHMKWTPEDSSLELQLVETHAPTAHTMGTTSYINLLLVFEPIAMPPPLPPLPKRAKRTAAANSD